MNTPLPMITLRQVGKSFGAHRVLRDINLEVHRGEVLVLIGPSGSGKTTALRCMNFLEEHDEGEVLIRGTPLGIRLQPDGRRVRDSEREIATVRAPLAMVFQQFNLWPHMSALGNVMAPLVLARGLSEARAREQAMAAIDRVGLSAKADLRPAALSGGQQQRVGIARALAGQPEVMLLDEPTSALDPELGDEVLEVIRSLSREGMTMVMVTHEMSFAAQVASRVAFLERGELVAVGTADEIIRRPTHPRIQAFLAPWVKRSLSVECEMSA